MIEHTSVAKPLGIVIKKNADKKQRRPLPQSALFDPPSHGKHSDQLLSLRLLFPRGEGWQEMDNNEKSQHIP